MKKKEIVECSKLDIIEIFDLHHLDLEDKTIEEIMNIHLPNLNNPERHANKRKITEESSREEISRVEIVDNVISRLALESHSLKCIVECGKIYVDKTDILVRLAKREKVYISRPRRFGKSLNLSILKEIFRGINFVYFR